MDKLLRVLIAEDSEDDALLIMRELRRTGYDPVSVRVDSADAMRAALTRQTWDVILSDHTMPQFSSLAALQVLKRSNLDIPFIIVSGKIGEEVAVAAMKAGASDYVMKDNLGRLSPAIERELREAEARRERRRTEETLRQSEQRYRALAESAQDFIFILNKDGSIQYVNRFGAKEFGYCQGEIIGKNMKEIFPPPVSERQWSNLQKVIESGKPCNIEQPTRFPNRELWLNTSLIPLKNEGGEVTSILGISRDITERRRTEEEIRKLNQFLEAVIDNANIWVDVLDEKGNVLMWNKAAEAMSGYSRAEVIGNDKVWEWLYPEEKYRRGIVERVAAGLEKEESREGIETIIRTKSGAERVISWYSRNLSNEKGVLMGLIALGRDVTEQKRAEGALRESEETLRLFLNANPDTMLLIDLQGTILVANESLSKGLGKPIDEIIGFCLYDLLSEDIARTRKSHLDGVVRTGEAIRFEDTRMGRDYETFAYPVFDGEGKVIKVAILGFDITMRKKMEQEIAKLQEQFRQVQKMEAIGHLAGGIAHDFNNLLTVIQGYSQISLMDLEEASPFRENIEEIRQAAERAAHLTRQLLAFSRKQVLEMKVLDLNSIVRNLDKMLRRVIGEDIELFLLSSEDPGRVKVDHGQIEQVLLNLAVNARDAMPSGGKLIIETAIVDLDEVYARTHVSVKPGRYVMLSMTDTGVGMSPDVLKQIFEPFFTTKERGKGTGLGLSTVYGIVKQSGGNIWVYSEPGKGTTFKIYLPKVDDPLEEPLEKRMRKELPGGGETILVVEDEQTVRKLTVKLLKQQGYKVLEAQHWEEALILCKESQYPIHLILTDVVMPEVNGPQLMERLKEVRRDFRVIYMSGYADNTIVKLGILDQGISFLQKPFTQDSLLHKVREVLDQ